MKLSPEQQEVLHLLSDEFLTIQQIALRRQTSDKAVYKTIQKLKKRGLLTRGLKKSDVGGVELSTPPSSNKYIRLHGVELRVRIIYKTEYYNKIRKEGNLISFDGCTVRLYENSFEIYTNKSFEANDEHRATANAIAYLEKLFIRLENDLKVIIRKPRANNIRIVKAHYAEVNNELAQDYNTKRRKLYIYAKEDGKLWFTIDHSFNLDEAETQHPETAKGDMTKVRTFFNDVRDKPSLLPSEITQNVGTLSATFSQFMQGQAEYAENLRTHVKAIKTLSESVSKFTREVRKFHEHQTRLKE